jgi:hypothetical protein
MCFPVIAAIVDNDAFERWKTLDPCRLDAFGQPVVAVERGTRTETERGILLAFTRLPALSLATLLCLSLVAKLTCWPS